MHRGFLCDATLSLAFSKCCTLVTIAKDTIPNGI